MGHTLIVEDDAQAARMVADLVAEAGHSAATAPSLHEARRQMALQAPDLLLLDLQLPDGHGLALLDDPELAGRARVVLMTGYASLDTSIRALRLGAADYLVKPVSARQIQDVLARAMAPATPASSTSPAPVPGRARTLGCPHLVGRSAPMRRLHEQVARVAPTSVTVFITGESGTGKELVARSVHDLSRRKDGPFLAVNCGAISPHLVESEIFGHERGSFTGAERQHQGYFERAQGGTLFLDEVTEMPPALQVKLLRVLESGTFMRVGSAVPQACDVRLVAATNRDPAQAVAAGTLREDLLYRLQVFPIEVPPLRDRLQDIPLLAEHFLRQIGEREGRLRRATPQALDCLARHDWPGNVRELRNALQRAWVMASGDEIAEAWLPQALPPRGAPASRAQLVAVGMTLAAAQRELIVATLAHCGHQREQAAALLGVSLRTLDSRMKACGLRGSPDEPAP